MMRTVRACRLAAALLSGAIVLVGVGGAAAPALAQQGMEAEDPAESRSTAFRAVSGPQTEDVPGGALLVGAYALVWILMLAFVVRLGFLHARTAREIEVLRRRLEEGGGPPTAE